MGRSSREDFQYQMIEERFAGLENRFAAYEGTANRLDRIFEDLERLKGLPDRVDRIEADLLKELEKLKAEVAQAQKSLAPKAAKTSTSGAKSGAKKPKKATYHRVKKGETLYSISKRYQTSVETIRQLNKMGPSDPIYPDQKLLVRP
jgi:LysM repeat protein